MGRTQGYKNYERQPRQQTSDETFKSGMHYTNNPLTDGFCKLSVNYDPKQSGETLHPRPGLRVTELGHFPVRFEIPTYSRNHTLSAGKLCTEENNKIYKQLILGAPSELPVKNTNLFYGEALALTIHESVFSEDLIPGVRTQEMLSAVLAGTVKYRVFRPSEIHGVPFIQEDAAGEQVGTFAFTNSYYYFGGPNKLYKTKFVPTPITEQYNTRTGTHTFPETFNLEAGKYSFTLAGGKGSDMLLGSASIARGGRGGTIRFNLDLAEDASVRIEKITNDPPWDIYGESFWIFVNAELYAAVGGGAGGVWWWSSNMPGDYYNLSNGITGSGGSEQGQDGDSTPEGGGGANGAIPGAAGINRSSGSKYKVYHADLGQVGYGPNDGANKGKGGGSDRRAGGCGYAGGGGGAYTIMEHRTTGAQYGVQGQGGGGSSFIKDDPAIEVLENSRGTNDDVAWVKITTYYDINRGRYESEEVPVKEITPKEAVRWGFNMLAENPYQFSDGVLTGDIDFQGLMVYDTNDQLLMTPEINQSLKLRLFYRGQTIKTYKFVWEWREPHAASWTKIREHSTALAGTPQIVTPFSSPVSEVLIRVSAYEGDSDIVQQSMTVGFNFDKGAYGSTANLEAKNYDLSNAFGMTYWKNRIVVYGVPQAPHTIFVSDINEPGYFPYPNNIDIFEEPIIHVLPFLEDLIIFTTTQIVLMTLNPDGVTWSKKVIQNNMAIREEEIKLIQVIKNMVFFKSGNYYYMIVPRLNSATGDLAVAPVSRNMEGFFDNFKNIVPKIVKELYYYEENLDLVSCLNFLDFEDIHNIYTFKSSDLNVYLNLDVLYNTVTRSWRLHLFESQFILKPYRQDATKPGVLMSTAELHQRMRDVNDSEYSEVDCVGIQFYQYNSSVLSESYIPRGFKLLIADRDQPEDIDELNTDTQFKNWQMLDMGFREHNTDINKRYREFQFKINNIGQESLKFLTEFYLDSGVRRPLYTYEVVQNTDPESPDFGLIYLERVPYILSGITQLGDEEAPELSAWTLDKDMFPDMILWKVRVNVTGKGMAPGVMLICQTEAHYELLNLIWVYRMMYSR